MAYTEFTLWLTPQQPLRSTLREIVRRLAAEFDAVDFEPHVTVFCGPANEAEARATAEAIAARFKPIELVADRLDHTDRYTKTLFVQFLESRAAEGMFEAAREAYSSPSDYVFNPHLSLLYKNLPESKQQELCRTLRAPMGAYVFDRVRMIETELPIDDAEPVRRWRVVADLPLIGE